MRKTFEELVAFDTDSKITDAFLSGDFDNIQMEVTNLLRLVRLKTLIECAKVCNSLQDTSTFSGWIDESLFLDLPEDSIEI